MRTGLIFITIIFYTLAGCDPGSTTPSKYTEPPQQQGTTYWWNEIVFYEIFVRSFYDSNGDGIGDLQGIIDKLDYLNDGDPDSGSDLGIGGLWLMPVSPSPSYHGYDVTDYRSINSDYGTTDDFLELVSACQQRGIKVIVDFVMNHSSSQHPWFAAAGDEGSSYHSWYRWSDFLPNYTGPWGQPVWHQHENNSYYFGIFWSGMPDLNYENTEVTAEMFATATFWLEEMGVDGFRCDAVKHLIEDDEIMENTEETLLFWQDFNSHYKTVNPQALAVGEAWDDSEIVALYTGDKFDFCFEFQLAESILSGINYSSASLIRSKMNSIKDLYPYHQYGTFLSNHDQNRVFDVLGEDPEKCSLAGAIYLTLPGIPFLYYGEEIAMSGTKPDPDIRRPMQWNSGPNAGFSTVTPWHEINSNYQVYNVESLQNEENSIWKQYQQIISLRSRENALKTGTYQGMSSGNPSIYCFLREYEQEGIIIIANLSAAPQNDISINCPSSNLLPGSYSVIDLLNDTALDSLQIDPEGAISGWSPVSPLAAHSIKLLKLTRI